MIITAKFTCTLNHLMYEDQEQLESLLKRLALVIKEVCPSATFDPNVELELAPEIGVKAEGGASVNHMMKVERVGKPPQYFRLKKVGTELDGNGNRTDVCENEEITEEEYIAAHKPKEE